MSETHDRHLAIKSLMMPRDTNPYGTIFGGVLLSYIDEAGAIGAMAEIRRNDWPERPVVTVAMNSVEFHQAVFVGDVVSFYTRVARVGRTSITMHVTVETDRGDGPIQLTQAQVTFVAVKIEGNERTTVPIRGEDAQ